MTTPESTWDHTGRPYATVGDGRTFLDPAKTVLAPQGEYPEPDEAETMEAYVRRIVREETARDRQPSGNFGAAHGHTADVATFSADNRTTGIVTTQESGLRAESIDVWTINAREPGSGVTLRVWGTGAFSISYAPPLPDGVTTEQTFAQMRAWLDEREEKFPLFPASND